MDDTPATATRQRSFADLHSHSSASFDSLSDPRKMMAKAVRLGLTHLAITDHGEDLAINGSNADVIVMMTSACAPNSSWVVASNSSPNSSATAPRRGSMSGCRRGND